MYFRAAQERGEANFGWLQSHHSFSFGRYYDPKHMGFSKLRVINDDTVAPGAGFPTHPHQDMEIITYVTEGVIEHEDSMGHKERIPAGDIQVMSAGTGVTHSEYNASKTDPLKFFQIWIEPNVKSIAPRYSQMPVTKQNQITHLVSPTGDNQTLKVHQDATIDLLTLEPEDTFEIQAIDRQVYVHVIEGYAELKGITIQAGDGVGLTLEEATIKPQQPLSAIVFKLPNEQFD